jgi:hypothetical protein
MVWVTLAEMISARTGAATADVLRATVAAKDAPESEILLEMAKLAGQVF